MVLVLHNYVCIRSANMFVEGGCSWDKRRRISPTNTDTDWLGVQNLFLERSRDTDTDTIRISLTVDSRSSRQLFRGNPDTHHEEIFDGSCKHHATTCTVLVAVVGFEDTAPPTSKVYDDR